MNPLRPWLITIWALAGFALVMALLLLGQKPAHAQVHCGQLVMILNAPRDNHQEFVVMTARDGTGKQVFLTRAETGKWTLIVSPQQGLGCVAAMGTDAQFDRGT